jgi:hypothetical protein
MLLVLMSVGFLVIAVGFAAAAVSSWLAAVYGPTVAAFVLAALFVLMAAATLAFAKWLHSSGQRLTVAELDNRGLGTSGTNLLAEPSDLLARSSELASLAAGMATGSRLKPFELVSLALLTGFMVGRRSGKK